MSALRWVAVGALSALSLHPGVAPAQDASASRALSREVERLIDNQSWAEASQRLDAGRDGCAAGADGRSCRLQLDYTQGYLLQSQSQTSPQAQADLLRASAAAYQRVLRDAPGHAATTHNLALVLGSLGDTERLERLLDEASARSAPLASGVAVALGDAYTASADWTNAYSAYARAARLGGEATAQRKMIQAAARLPSVPEAMPALVRDWSTRTPAIAAEAYAAMARIDVPQGRDSGEEALLAWLTLTADARAVSRASASQAFAGMDDAAIMELIGFLGVLEAASDERFTDPREARAFPTRYPPVIERFPWWRQTTERRHALGLAALSMGRSSAAAGKPVRAQYQLLVGLQSAPEMSEYLFADPRHYDRLLPLDLITELVWLQVSHPDLLDPSGEKFEGFIDLLLDGKGEAYQSRDLVSIQRHHMVLGPIFASRGQWTGGRYGFDNAIFQLSRAIRAANEREARDGFHQALPAIKAMLADGYQATDQPALECTARIDAVKAALDSDDLGLARAQLASLLDARPTRAQRAIADTLRAIIDAREAVHAGDSRRLGPWVDAESVDGLDTAFLRRQQFKLLADRLDTLAGARRDVLAHAARDRAGAVATLIGMEDVLRLERIATVLGGEAVVPAPRMTIHPAGESDASGQGRWLVSLPASDLPYIASFPEPGTLAMRGGN